MSVAIITAGEARDWFTYNPETGVICNRIQRHRSSKAPGVPLGFLNCKGYLVLAIRGKKVRAHRLAFLIHLGRWPEGEVDHADGDRTNNCWSNLRECSRTENNRNVGMPRTNTSGHRGVDRQKQKWRARMRVNGRKAFLGLFETPEEASAAYEAKAKQVRGRFYREP